MLKTFQTRLRRVQGEAASLAEHVAAGGALPGVRHETA